MLYEGTAEYLGQDGLYIQRNKIYVIAAQELTDDEEFKIAVMITGIPSLFRYKNSDEYEAEWRLVEAGATVTPDIEALAKLHLENEETE